MELNDGGVEWGWLYVGIGEIKKDLVDPVKDFFFLKFHQSHNPIRSFAKMKWQCSFLVLSDMSDYGVKNGLGRYRLALRKYWGYWD